MTPAVGQQTSDGFRVVKIESHVVHGMTMAIIEEERHTDARGVPLAQVETRKFVGIDPTGFIEDMAEFEELMIDLGDVPRPDLSRGTHKVIGLELGPGSFAGVVALDGTLRDEIRPQNYPTGLMSSAGLMESEEPRSQATIDAEQRYLNDQVDAILRNADLEPNDTVPAESSVTIGVTCTGYDEDPEYELPECHFRLHQHLLRRCAAVGVTVAQVDEAFVTEFCPDCRRRVERVRRKPRERRCTRCSKTFNRHILAAINTARCVRAHLQGLSRPSELSLMDPHLLLSLLSTMSIE